MHIKSSFVCEAKALNKNVNAIKCKTNVNAECKCSTLKTDSIKCQAIKKSDLNRSFSIECHFCSTVGNAIYPLIYF